MAKKFKLSDAEKDVLRKGFEKALNGEAEGFIFFFANLEKDGAFTSVNILCPNIYPVQIFHYFMEAAIRGINKGQFASREEALADNLAKEGVKWQ